MKEISKKELQVIYGCLIQSAANNEIRLCDTISILTEELNSLQASDFDRRKEIRTQMLRDLIKEGDYVDWLLDIAKRIKQMEQE